jgi:hypothetical protein
MMTKSKRKFEADTSLLLNIQLHHNTQKSPKTGVKENKGQRRQNQLQDQDLILGIIERIKNL